MLDTTTRTIFDEDHALFRESVRTFMSRELIPHIDRWERDGIVDRAFWDKAGDAGLLCPSVPEAYGGLGLDFRYNIVVNEELAYAGSSAGLPLQSDIAVDYIVHYGSEEQKRRWLPGMVSGEIIAAIAMTEPSAGSDLQGIRMAARRSGNHYVLNGSKIYITNGQNADLVITVARTDPAAGSRGISLILVDTASEGFERGRNLDKIGQHAADTSELFYHDVRVPTTDCLGEEGAGFSYLMSQLPQERLSIAIASQASAQRALDEAVAFTRERKAFGKAILDFQSTRFTLADIAARLQVGWAHIDWATQRLLHGELSAREASAAKLWHTRLHWDACDAALQLHGGAGYMNEYPIARLWRDARVARIYGGTDEIMKEIIGRGF